MKHNGVQRTISTGTACVLPPEIDEHKEGTAIYVPCHQNHTSGHAVVAERPATLELLAAGYRGRSLHNLLVFPAVFHKGVRLEVYHRGLLGAGVQRRQRSQTIRHRHLLHHGAPRGGVGRVAVDVVGLHGEAGIVGIAGVRQRGVVWIEGRGGGIHHGLNPPIWGRKGARSERSLLPIVRLSWQAAGDSVEGMGSGGGQPS